jgi:hypothetical protein
LDEAEREFKDKWDGMVTVQCPQGDHVATRLTLQQVEQADDLIVQCGECGHRFDWHIKPT